MTKISPSYSRFLQTKAQSGLAIARRTGDQRGRLARLQEASEALLKAHPVREDSIASEIIFESAVSQPPYPAMMRSCEFTIDAWSLRDSTRILLLRARSFPESGDVEQYVGEQLGGLGFRSPFSLFRFERWLTNNYLQLVIFIDGINEFADELSRCVGFADPFDRNFEDGFGLIYPYGILLPATRLSIGVQIWL